jgi:hypothetical protein
MSKKDFLFAGRTTAARQTHEKKSIERYDYPQGEGMKAILVVRI